MVKEWVLVVMVLQPNHSVDVTAFRGFQEKMDCISAAAAVRKQYYDAVMSDVGAARAAQLSSQCVPVNKPKETLQ